MTPTRKVEGEEKKCYLVFQLITSWNYFWRRLSFHHKKEVEKKREEKSTIDRGKTLCKGKKQREMALFRLMYQPCGSEKTASHILRGKKRMITLFC